MSEPLPPPAGAPIPSTHLDSEFLRMLMETIPDRIYFKDLESRFVRVSKAHAEWLGCESPEQVIGRSDSDFFASGHAKAAHDAEREIIRTGAAVVERVEKITKQDGEESWGSTTKLPWRDASGKIIGTFGLTRNITAIKEAEEMLIAERNRLRTIIDHLPSSIFVKDLAGRYVINNAAHVKILGLKGQDDAVGRTVRDFYPEDRALPAIEDDRKVVTEGISIVNQEETYTARDGSLLWALTTKVPLYDARSRIVGLVGITHDITARRRTDEELRERTAQMEDNLRMACKMQESFFPRVYPVFPLGVPPEASALRFAHRYHAAATLGGDFFDAIRVSDSSCLIIICDVMGHGVQAGLLTAMIRGVVREIGSHSPDPAHIVGEINRSLLPILEQTGQPLFATVFCGVFDTQEGTLTHANAGHPAPVVFRRQTGTAELIRTADPEPATGLIGGFTYSRATVKLEPGDVFIGYTDGLFEAADAGGNLFGEDRLHALIARDGHLPLEDLNARLISEVRTHTGSPFFEDDVCILAVEAVGNTCLIEPLVYEI